MKKDAKISRSLILQVRLTPEEYKKIHDKFSQSTTRNRSGYIRKLLLDKPVSIVYRNKSLDDFMIEMIALRNELNAIGNNFNQMVKKLHTLQYAEPVRLWAAHTESTRQILLNKVDIIKEKINSISDQWLQ